MGTAVAAVRPERALREIRPLTHPGPRAIRWASQARSSVGEHYLDTVGVGGSIPPVPTASNRKHRFYTDEPEEDPHDCHRDDSMSRPASLRRAASLRPASMSLIGRSNRRTHRGRAVRGPSPMVDKQ